MRLKLIACKALARELGYLSALSPHAIDITWMRQGYHAVPKKLHEILQEEIDRVESGEDAHTNAIGKNDFDAILLGYGLCSNAAAGLYAKNHRLVIPRAHDCITLLLGSKERYTEKFHEYKGCYWYTASWVEGGLVETEETQKEMEDFYRGKGWKPARYERVMKEMNKWIDEYGHAAYISMPQFDQPEYEAVAKEAASYFGWQYHREEGDTSLMADLVNGEWDSDRFLVLEPGQHAEAAAGEGIICAADAIL